MKQISHNSYSPIIANSEGYFLAKLFLEKKTNIVFIAANEKKLLRLSDEISYFLGTSEIIQFHHWDCLPYDRVSPSANTVGSRIRALFDIIHLTSPQIIITTPQSLIQKIIPKNILMERSLTLRVKQQIERDDLLAFLVSNGFNRSSIASEPGDFAVRGSIIDIFDIATHQGYRIDFFGKIIETIKYFDPITQITNKSIEKAELLPVSEVIFDTLFADNFKHNFKQIFSASAVNDPLCDSVSEKRKFQGIEHFLPLFYGKLDDIFSYLPKNSLIVFDNFLLQNITDQQKSIDDYYSARVSALSDKYLKQDFKYYPVPKDSMWLGSDEVKAKFNNFKLIEISNFELSGVNAQKVNYKIVPNFLSDSKIHGKAIFDLIKEYKAKINKKIILSAFSEGSLARLKTMLDANNIHYYFVAKWQDYKNVSGKSFGITISKISQGFEGEDFALISEQDIFGEKSSRTIKSSKKLENLLSEAASFHKGELVVHTEHGIGRFEGLETLTVSGVCHDFLLLIYDGGDKLFLPVENIEVITRYGEDNENAKLDRLGGLGWQERKAKIKKRIREIAGELLKIAAERELKTAQIISPYRPIYDEFIARFPYVETEDQTNAIIDVENDMASGKPMDRLICGDVGFGKTEIALRAAFIATHSEDVKKAQVAVIVPTTILAKQHFENFLKRFSGFGVNIRELSRFVTAKEAKETKKALAEGSVDIIIGTHSLLANDIKFQNLQLVIIDEEQHFGVAQKERLKQLKSGTHVLTLSATPIPRTMQMSLVGIKELSLIATPPVDRLVIKTYIMPYDHLVVKEAIMREYHRGGKCFFVAPRISDLSDIKLKLDALVPELKTVIAHGQKTPAELDSIMHDFYNGKFDILLSTSIIESGLDIPTANTIFIYKADMFGLSALYQLRGRVGRSNIRAYAYFLLPHNKKPSKIATKRLEVMQTLDSLGVGFTIATHDMDIRGFGNLLGDEQSGHIKEVGVELYQAMLSDTIAELNHQQEHVRTQWSPQINVGIPVMIPEHYISDIHLRMGIYRRVAALETNKEIEEFKSELIDRFGKYPEEIDHLLTIVSIKILCKQANIEKIDAGEKAIVIGFRDNKFANPEKLLEFVLRSPGSVKLRPDEKLVFVRSHEDIQRRVAFVFQCINQIIGLI